MLKKLAVHWCGVLARSINHRELARYSFFYHYNVSLMFASSINSDDFMQEHELEDEDVVQIIKKI